MRLVVHVAGYVVLSTAGLVLLRSSLAQAGRPAAELLRDPRLLVGGALYAASFLAWLSALRYYQLSVIYPVVVGLGYTAVLLASVVFLDEHISGARAVGMLLVGVGILLLAR